MASYTVEVTVDASTTGTITNVVQVDSPDDAMVATNTTTEDTAIDTLADLNISKAVLTSPVIAGQSVQYEVTVNNPGPSDALNVSVADVIPAPSMAGVLTYNAGLSSTECSASGAMMTGDTVTCTVASIPAGGAQMFTIGFDLSSDAMGTLDNSATVSSDTPEANATDNTDAAPTVTIDKDADLQMEKIPAADPVVAGGQVTYTLKVTNQGPSDAESIEVTDTFPAELSNPVAMLPCVIVGAGPFTWAVGNLAAGAMATCDVTFDIASSATMNIANSATVMSTVTPETTNTFPNTAVTSNPVNREADVVVMKTGPASIILTTMDVFTVTISNPTGPSDVTVQLVDTLPPMFTFVAAGSTLPTPCMQMMQTLTCDPVALPVGLTINYILNLTAGGVPNTTVTNSATANITDGTETTPADNTATHDVMLIGLPPVIGMGAVPLQTVGNTRLDVSGAAPPLTPEGEASSTAPVPSRSRAGSRPGADPEASPKDHGGVPAVQLASNIMTLAAVTDPEMDALVFSVSALNMSVGTFIITNAATGEFTYDPPAGCSTTPDTLTYDVTDTFTAPVTGTLVVTAADCIWFVDNSHTPNGAGTSVNPFNKLSDGVGDANPDDGEDASSDGEDIFVFAGDGTTTGQNSGIELNNDQRLIGEGVALDIFDSMMTLNGVPGPIPLFPAGSNPLIGGGGVSNDVKIIAIFAALVGIEVRGLTMTGTGTNGIFVFANNTFNAEVLIANNQFGTATEQIDVNGILATNLSTGAWTLAINDNSFVNVGFDGMNLTGPGFITSFSGNTFDGFSSGVGVTTDGVQMTNVTFDADPSIGVSGTPVGMSGMLLTNVSGDVNFGLASGVLNIFATNTGLQANGTGAINAGLGTGFQITVPDGSTIAGGVMAAPLTEAPSVVDEEAAADGLVKNSVIHNVAVGLDPLTGFFGTSGGAGVTVVGENLAFTDVDGAFHFNSTSDIDSNAGADAFSVLYNSPISPLTAVFTYSGDLDVTAGGLLIKVDGLDTGSSVTFDDAGGASHTLGSSAAGGGISLVDVQGDFTLDANLTNLFLPAGDGISITGDSDGMLRFDDVSITGATGTALNVDGTAGSIGATIDANDVDINQGGAGTVALIDNLGTGGSVDFDSASFITGTGTGANRGITITDNADSTSITFNGDVNLGIDSGVTITRINSIGVTMTGNTGGGTPTTVSFADLDIFTTGADGIFGTGEGQLTNASGRIDTIDGTAININGSGTGIDFTNTTLNFATIVVNNTNADRGVRIQDFTGTANLGVVTLNTNNGTALELTNGGKVTTLPGSTINATSGTGIFATNVDFGTGSLHFDSVSANPSLNDGVEITNTSGRVNIMGGTIVSPSSGLQVIGSPSSLELVVHNTNLSSTTNGFFASFSTGNLCLSMAGNTLVGNLRLDQSGTGTISVVQGGADSSVLSAVNGGATVVEFGTIIYGQGCLTGGGPFGTPPVAQDDPNTMVDEDMTVSINVIDGSAGGLDSDPDAGDIISVRGIMTAPTMGTATVVSPTNILYDYTGPFLGLTNSFIDTFVYEITDKAGNIRMATVTVTVNGVAIPPSTAAADSYETAGNTLLEVANSVIYPSTAKVSVTGDLCDNDTDGGGGLTIVAVNGIADNGAGDLDGMANGMIEVATTGLGRAKVTTATCELAYMPPADSGGAITMDSFTYDLFNGMGPATVNITFVNQVWYIDNSHTPDADINNDGTSPDPFPTVAALVAAGAVVGANDTIFIHEGSSGTTAYMGPVTIDDDGQRLIGEGVALTIPDTLTQQTVPVPGPQTLLAMGTHPQIDSAANDVDVTTSASALTGIEVMGIHGIGSIHGINVSVTGSGSAAATIANNIIGTTGGSATGPTMNGLNAVNTSTGALAIAFNNNTVNTVGVNGASINGAGATGETFVTSLQGNTFLGVSGSQGVGGTGVFMTTVTFAADADSTNFTGDTVPAGGNAVGASGIPVGTVGMVLMTVSGDVNFGLASGVLNVFATNEGLQAVGTGLLNAAAGTGFQMTVPDGSTIAGGGAALAPPLSEEPGVLPKGIAMPMATGAAADLDPMTAFFGTMAGSGVALLGESASFDQIAGALFFNNSSALTGGAADVFSVIGSTADVTYEGTIVDNTGTGITLDTNGAGGSASFTGMSATVDLGTGTALTNAALEMTGNNATFAANFANLDIVTSNAVGILGTAGGMLDIDTGTVTTTGESAVDIDGIDFGTTINLTNVTSNGTGMGDPGIDLSNVTGTFNGGIAAIGTTTPNNAIGIRVMGSSAAIGFTTVNIDNASGDGIEINGSSGSFDVTGNTTIDTGSGAGIDVIGSTTDIGFGGALSITNAGTAINIDGTGGTPADFDVVGAANLGVGAGNTVTTGINLVDHASSTTFSFSTVNIGTVAPAATTGLSFMNNTGAPTVNFTTALNVTNSGGPGIFAMSAGMISSAAGIINTANGAGIDATGPTFAATFSVVSGGSGNVQRGINLEDIGGMLTMSGGTIPTGTTMEAFRVHGGDAAVSYGGTIANAADNAVLIEDVTGGSVTLSGSLINEDGSGLLVQNNTGGTFTFSGASVDIDPSGANVGVTLSSNTGATIDFTNGGLTIDTTSGTGFSATGGGTVSVTTGANPNTINSTTGTALNVASTTLGGSGVTFQSISAGTGASGPTVGIDINTAGTTGFFTVTGTGTTNGSGGTIQNTSQNGILIQNTDNITLNNMNLTNAADEGGGPGSCDGTIFSGCRASIEFNTVVSVDIDNLTLNGSDEHGIFGNSVTDFDFSNSLVQNAGDAQFEHGIFLNNLFGTSGAGTDSLISNTTVELSATNNVQIRNTLATSGSSANPDLVTINNSTIRNLTQATGSNGLFVNRGMHFTPDYPTSCGWPVRLPRRCWTISE